MSLCSLEPPKKPKPLSASLSKLEGSGPICPLIWSRITLPVASFPSSNK